MKPTDLAVLALCAGLITYWMPLVLLAWRAGASSIALPLTLLLLLLVAQFYRRTARVLRLALKPASTSRPSQPALPVDDTH